MTRLRFTIFLIAFLSVFLFANKTKAASNACGVNNAIQLSVHIPGLTKRKEMSGIIDAAKRAIGSTATEALGTSATPHQTCYYIEGGLPQYIAGIYNFGLMVAGFLAMVMIMIGGFMYVAAGGNQTIIGKAKERIFNALIGLVILLLSYTILHTINPELVSQTESKRTLGEKVPPAPVPGTTTSPATPAAGGATQGNGPRSAPIQR